MKHDTKLPAQFPYPLSVYLLYFVIGFSTLYIPYIFPVEIQTWPLVIFLTHKNTKKSHYKDTQL